MINLEAPSRFLAEEMYFLATVAAVPSSASWPGIQAGPVLVNISQPALPQHTHTFRRLRALSGLSMTRLSEVLGVERRTLYFWEDGKPIQSSNEAHLEAILNGIESVGEFSPDLMRRSIMAINEQGLSSADRFRERKYLEAVEQLAKALRNRGNSWVGRPAMNHRSLAELLAVEESDEGLLTMARPPKRGKLPGRAAVRRA